MSSAQRDDGWALQESDLSWLVVALVARVSAVERVGHTDPQCVPWPSSDRGRREDAVAHVVQVRSRCDLVPPAVEHRRAKGQLAPDGGVVSLARLVNRRGLRGHSRNWCKGWSGGRARALIDRGLTAPREVAACLGVVQEVVIGQLVRDTFAEIIVVEKSARAPPTPHVTALAVVQRKLLAHFCKCSQLCEEKGGLGRRTPLNLPRAAPRMRGGTALADSPPTL